MIFPVRTSFFAVIVVFAGSSLFGMNGANYLHKHFSLAQVIAATNDPVKIRKKVMSLWEKDEISFCLLLSKQAGGSDPQIEIRTSNERRQDALVLKDYFITEVLKPALRGTIFLEDTFKIIDRLARADVLPDASLQKSDDDNYGIFGSGDEKQSPLIAYAKAVVYKYSPSDTSWFKNAKTAVVYGKYGSGNFDPQAIKTLLGSIEQYVAKSPVVPPLPIVHSAGLGTKTKIALVTTLCAAVGAACWYVYTSPDSTDSDAVSNDAENEPAAEIQELTENT